MRKRTFLAVSVATSLVAAGLVPAQAQAAAGKKHLALLLYSHGFEFMVALDKGARQEADTLGVDLTVLDGQSDSQVQTRQIEDLLVRGVDAIIISPNDSKEIVPAIRHANEAKVPVVALDAVVGEGAQTVTYVGFANADGARMAAQYITDHVKDGSVHRIGRCAWRLPRPRAASRLHGGHLCRPASQGCPEGRRVAG